MAQERGIRIKIRRRTGLNHISDTHIPCRNCLSQEKALQEHYKHLPVGTRRLWRNVGAGNMFNKDRLNDPTRTYITIFPRFPQLLKEGKVKLKEGL